VVGKLAIPVIREGNGCFRAHLMGKTEHLEGRTTSRASRTGSERWVLQQDHGRGRVRGDPIRHGGCSTACSTTLAANDSPRGSSSPRRGWRERGQVLHDGGNDDDPEVLELLKDANTESHRLLRRQRGAIDDHHT
jgi:hypothetical protein